MDNRQDICSGDTRIKSLSERTHIYTSPPIVILEILRCLVEMLIKWSTSEGDNELAQIPKSSGSAAAVADK